MIYFFYGEDDFRIRQRIAELRAGLTKTDNNIDVQIRSATKLTRADLADLSLAQSLLSRSKLVVIYSPIEEGSEDFRLALSELLSAPLPEGVVLILVEPRPDQRTKLFKALNKFIVEHYPPLKGAEARKWVQAQTQLRGADLSTEAISMLVDSFGDDLWRMSSELDKLSLFSAGQTIGKAEIDQLVPRPLTDDIFATIEALAKKNFALANQLINRQLALGMPEQQLLSMIAYQFRNIVALRAWLDKGTKISDLASKAQLHPYVVQKTSELARRFSILELAKIFHLLQRVDAAIKTGKTPPRVGLDILTAQVVNA